MRALLAITCVLVAFFVAFPGMDERAAEFFYQPGEGFSQAWHPIVRAIYEAVPYVGRGTVVVALLLIALKAATRRLKRIPYKPLLFAALLMLLGPGLVVHAVLKDGFNRPRPSQTVTFGGEEAYTPPFRFGGTEGQSFVSGHAATGFYFAGLALLIRNRLRRRFCMAGGVALGIGIGFIRMVQGGHYLSDVLFAGVAVMWVAYGLYWALFTRMKSPAPEA